MPNLILASGVITLVSGVAITLVIFISPEITLSKTFTLANKLFSSILIV